MFSARHRPQCLYGSSTYASAVVHIHIPFVHINRRTVSIFIRSLAKKTTEKASTDGSLYSLIVDILTYTICSVFSVHYLPFGIKERMAAQRIRKLCSLCSWCVQHYNMHVCFSFLVWCWCGTGNADANECQTEKMCICSSSCIHTHLCIIYPFYLHIYAIHKFYISIRKKNATTWLIFYLCLYLAWYMHAYVLRSTTHK